MQTKLTLRVDHVLISQAKAFAKTTGKSLSQMVTTDILWIKIGEIAF